MCCVPYSWNYTCGAKKKVVNFENLTNLTRWPQPAAILIVKICKNPVFGVAKLQEPNLVPTQHTEIDIEPKSSQNRANNAPRSTTSSQNWAKSGETRLWNWVRNLYIQFAFRILTRLHSCSTSFLFKVFLAKKLLKFTYLDTTLPRYSF